MTKILFLEDHASVRESVSAAILNMDSSFEIVQAGNIEDAIKILSHDTRIKTAVIDLSLAAATTQQLTGGGYN